MEYQRLKHSYVIGTHIMFYEIEMVKNYVASLAHSILLIHPDDRHKITVDYMFNMTEKLEKIDGGVAKGLKLRQRCKIAFYWLQELGINLNEDCKSGDVLYTMTNYRRNLNTKYCTEVDYVIWGETDCLAPRELFVALDEVKDLTK